MRFSGVSPYCTFGARINAAKRSAFFSSLGFETPQQSACHNSCMAQSLRSWRGKFFVQRYYCKVLIRSCEAMMIIRKGGLMNDDIEIPAYLLKIKCAAVLHPQFFNKVGN